MSVQGQLNMATLRTTLRAWRAGLAVEKYTSNEISANDLIWLNPNIPHFYKMLDPYAWTKYDVKLISQIISQNALASFSQLSATQSTKPLRFSLFATVSCFRSTIPTILLHGGSVGVGENTPLQMCGETDLTFK